MRPFSIISVIAAAALGTSSVASHHSIYHDTVVDLDEVIAASYNVQATVFGLTEHNFAVESHNILSGLYNIVAVGAKFDKQAFDRKAMDAEQEQKVLAYLTIFVNAQRTLMGELIQKYPMALENYFTAQIAEGIRVLQSGTHAWRLTLPYQEAEDAFTRVVPQSSVKAVKAKFVSHGRVYPPKALEDSPLPLLAAFDECRYRRRVGDVLLLIPPLPNR
ncbi:hypothetical protein TRAPUB_10432 [Trametes pubescens]|uniref:Uncharacterized protein n=1 Tax=Trametes pubescens TaxID=154538 RepID=A0A1M2VZQ4_TRAPU|nr:hypothetical protein TRAPUB_10432 [Trametes pubescens]